MPSSRGSSQPRDQAHVSCIAGRFFSIWVTRSLGTHKILVKLIRLIKETGEKSTQNLESRNTSRQKPAGHRRGTRRARGWWRFLSSRQLRGVLPRSPFKRKPLLTVSSCRAFTRGSCWGYFLTLPLQSTTELSRSKKARPFLPDTGLSR